MDDDAPNEAFAELKTGSVGGWGLAQIAAGTGLAVYAMWVGVLQPGFRKVPLKLQVSSMTNKSFLCCSACASFSENLSEIHLPGPIHSCKQNSSGQCNETAERSTRKPCGFRVW